MRYGLALNFYSMKTKINTKFACLKYLNVISNLAPAAFLMLDVNVDKMKLKE